MSHAIGIDLGGTKIEAALVDDTGKRVERFRIPTGAEEGPERIYENLCKAIDEVKQDDISGIGIGTPGFIHENELASSPNVPGLHKALQKLQQSYDVVIENDANCFALAEHKWGAGEDVDSLIGVIWGTGIGGGIIMNNRLLRGATGGAGEIGHMILDKEIETFSPGGRGTWEYLCSGPNIQRRYEEAGGKMEDARPDQIFDSEEAAAEKVKDDTLKYMGVALGTLVNILNPEKIVLGGGVSNLDVYEELNEQMRKYSIDVSGQSCKVVKNQLGDSSGVLGAAALVLD